MKIIPVFYLVLIFFLPGCQEKKTETRFTFKNFNRETPEFSADSAYAFIASQVQMGPRVPGSTGHARTRVMLVETLKHYAGQDFVYEQHFTTEGYDEQLSLTNIIASFNVEATERILLCAHWDTRPRADEEPDQIAASKPITGADDGGSGVGVILELARLFSLNKPPLGVDIVLFDGEDYGKSGDLSYYFLGSRYWSKNPPVRGYMPRFGILLDMVGGEGAHFPKEAFSVLYAAPLVDELWNIASSKGYGHLFSDMKGGAVADDHMILNQEYGLPTINIIHYYSNGEDVNFPLWWHTHNDTMEIISKETLQSVGDVLVEFIYNRIK